MVFLRSSYKVSQRRRGSMHMLATLGRDGHAQRGTSRGIGELTPVDQGRRRHAPPHYPDFRECLVAS